MSGIDSRKDAYTITAKIFKIIGVELNVENVEKMWLVIDEVFALVDRADRLEEMIDRMSDLRYPKESWEEFTDLEMIDEINKRDSKLIDYVLIIEQFQKLLGVYTTTEALAKVAVLMREETEAERLLSKALGHLRTCSDPEGDDLYDEIAAAFGETHG